MKEHQKQIQFAKVLFLRKQLKKSNSSATLFPRIGLLLLKYEILSNLSYQKPIYKIIINDSKKLIEQNLESFEKQTQDINEMTPIGEHYSYLEQIKDSLFVSGSYYQLDSKRQTEIQIIRGQSVQKYQMLQQRSAHKSTFNQKDLVYLVGGFQTNTAESFNLRTQKSTALKSLPIKKKNFLFGIAYGFDNVFLWGGYNGSSLSEILYFDSATQN